MEPCAYYAAPEQFRGQHQATRAKSRPCPNEATSYFGKEPVCDYHRQALIGLRQDAVDKSDCTGYIDTYSGTLQHDGDTCPIHEAQGGAA